MNYLITFILVALTLVALPAKRLVFIECVTRHGVRYPAFPNPHDYSNISQTENARSQLTKEGRHMHFALGRILYKKYWSALFPNTTATKFNNSLIYAKSTNTNRTIQSLQNLLMGLLAQLQSEQVEFSPGVEIKPPFKSPLRDEADEDWNKFWLRQRTVPIHVEKGAEGDPGIANSFNEGDFMVKQEYNLCPNQLQWEQANLNSDIVARIMNSSGIRKALQRLQPHFNGYPLDFGSLYKVVDNYNCLKAMGRPYLHIFQDEEISLYLQFARLARLYVTYLHTQQQIKTFSHGLVAATLSNFRRAIQNTGPRLVFYSGHDVTLAILMAAFNMTNTLCLFESYIEKKAVANCYLDYPQFASSFVFQLWEEEGEYLVEVWVNGEEYKLPVCNQQGRCRLQSLESWFEGWTIENSANEECGVPSVKSQQIYIEMAIVFSLGVAIPFVLYFCFRKKNEGRVGSSTLRMEDDLE